MKLSYKKKLKRTKPIFLPDSLIKPKKESIEFSYFDFIEEEDKSQIEEDKEQKEDEEKKVKKIFDCNFKILNLFLIKENNFSDLISYDYQKSLKDEYSILLETKNYNFILKSEWKEIPFKINKEFIVLKCNFCEDCLQKEIIFFEKNEKFFVEISNNCSYFLVLKNDFLTVTNLIKYSNCIYEPLNSKNISNWPHLQTFQNTNTSNLKKMVDSALLGICAHKIVQTSYPLSKILEEVSTNILSSFTLDDEQNINNFLSNLKKKLYEFYQIKFKDFECEVAYLNDKLNLIFVIDLIFDNQIVELKNGRRGFSHILQVLYYFICSEQDKLPFLFYFEDLFNKKIIPAVKYDHSLLESMIIKRNVVGMIDNFNEKIDGIDCTCQFDSPCKQIEGLKKSEGLKKLFFQYLMKCLDIEENEETKKIDVNNFFHISENNYNYLFNEKQKNFSNKKSILVLQNIDISKYQIINFHMNHLKVCKGFFLRKYKNLYFYQLTCLVDLPFTDLNIIENFLNRNIDLETSFIKTLENEDNKSEVIIEISKSTESFKIQRFGLLNSYFLDIFDEKYMNFYREKYLKKMVTSPQFKDFKELNDFISYEDKDSKANENSFIELSDLTSTDYDWEEVNSIKSKEIDNFLYIPQKYINEYKILNNNQQNALQECLSFQTNENRSKNKTKKITGIHGMPGTGKTKLLSLLIKILNYHKKRVLVVTFTNKSLENLRNKISLNTKTYQTSTSLKSLKNENKNNLENLIKEYKNYLEEDAVIFSNVNNLNDPIFLNIKSQPFDYLIVDEAGQLPLLYFNCLYNFSKRIIAVGDHLQLKPVSSKGLIISLLQFIEVDISITLNIQYRMKQRIMDAANVLFYSNKMLPFDNSKNIDKGLTQILSIKKEKSLYENINEIIHKKKIDNSNCKILCFFNRTKEELNKKKEKQSLTILEKIKNIDKKPNLELKAETIDRFQGSEMDTIILVLDDLNNEITNCNLRLNVALTRAQSNFIILGDLGFLEKNYQKFKCKNLVNKFLCDFDGLNSIGVGEKGDICKMCSYRIKYCLKNNLSLSVINFLTVIKFFERKKY